MHPRIKVSDAVETDNQLPAAKRCTACSRLGQAVADLITLDSETVDMRVRFRMLTRKTRKGSFKGCTVRELQRPVIVGVSVSLDGSA